MLSSDSPHTPPAAHEVFLDERPHTDIPKAELTARICENISHLRRSVYENLNYAAMAAEEVLDEITTQIRNYPETTRMNDLNDLFQSTEYLKQREHNNAILLQTGLSLTRNDPHKSRAWKKFGATFLILTGAALFVAGTFALCSGLGALPGSFIASAGTWLLTQAGLTANTTLAVGAASCVTALGTASLMGAACQIHGIFRNTAREGYYSEINFITHGHKP